MNDAERLDAIFKAYDIRGVVPDELDPHLCRAIGAAFARFAGADRILLARDMRPSGPEMIEEFAAGICSQGVDVVDLGLASTDLLYFASGKLDAPGAVFTASHNPARYNGIKMCLAGAVPVGSDSGLEQIKQWASEGLPPVGDAAARSSMNLLDDFVDHVLGFVDTSLLRPLKIVADTANGMGGLVVPAVFAKLPFDLEIMYEELDGNFPNHPADPLNPENLRDLQRRVLETGADIGMAFDGDADRVFFVDEKAQPVSGSTTTAILAQAMLAKFPDEKVIHNLICSKAVPEVILENGGTPVRTRVGHSFIKQVMADEDAVFGGEHSAHYYFRENFRADSGLIAAVVLLEQLCVSGQTFSEFCAPYNRYAASGEINTTVDDAAAIIERVAAGYPDAEQDRLDGLTVDLGDWWFNLRSSNTEPLLRLNLEAADEAGVQARVSEVRSFFAQ
jgi:phosphomannomutase